VRYCAVGDGYELSGRSAVNTGITADGLVLAGKARKSTGSLHGTRYSMPKVQGRCLSSAGQ